MGHLIFQSTPILRNEFITWYQQSECRNEDQTYRSLTPFQTDTRIDAKEILTSGSDLSAQQQRPLGNSKPAISLFHIITIASDLQPAQNRPTAAHPPKLHPTCNNFSSFLKSCSHAPTTSPITSPLSALYASSAPILSGTAAFPHSRPSRSRVAYGELRSCDGVDADGRGCGGYRGCPSLRHCWGGGR